MTKESLKLITLNTWGGRELEPLMIFFAANKKDTDIFCLQEVRNCDQKIVDDNHPNEKWYGPLFEKISAELEDFTGSFAYFDDDPNRMSLAMFIRRSIPIKIIEDFIVFSPKEPAETGSRVFSPRKLQYAVLDWNGKELLVANYHGLWDAGPKTDTFDRIAQSNTLKEFLNKSNESKIICGDFNLLPSTQSMKILESGMVNLINKYNVGSTRTTLYRHFENLDEPNFADYILTSPDIKVLNFKVLSDVVS
ncbi:MAG: hypothetical protein Q7S12_00015, partial [bacterium]|nr:hypothetical protein [bacterium]